MRTWAFAGLGVGFHVFFAHGPRILFKSLCSKSTKLLMKAQHLMAETEYTARDMEAGPMRSAGTGDVPTRRGAESTDWKSCRRSRIRLTTGRKLWLNGPCFGQPEPGKWWLLHPGITGLQTLGEMPPLHSPSSGHSHFPTKVFPWKLPIKKGCSMVIDSPQNEPTHLFRQRW